MPVCNGYGNYFRLWFWRVIQSWLKHFGAYFDNRIPRFFQAGLYFTVALIETIRFAGKLTEPENSGSVAAEGMSRFLTLIDNLLLRKVAEIIF